MHHHHQESVPIGEVLCFACAVAFFRRCLFCQLVGYPEEAPPGREIGGGVFTDRRIGGTTRLRLAGPRVKDMHVFICQISLFAPPTCRAYLVQGKGARTDARKTPPTVSVPFRLLFLSRGKPIDPVLSFDFGVLFALLVLTEVVGSTCFARYFLSECVCVMLWSLACLSCSIL